MISLICVMTGHVTGPQPRIILVRQFARGAATTPTRGIKRLR